MVSKDLFSVQTGVEYRAVWFGTEKDREWEMYARMRTIRIEGKEVELIEEFPVRFACMEHVEEELDDYVNEFEAAPNTYRASSIEMDHVDKRCRVCGEPGQIALLREKGM